MNVFKRLLCLGLAVVFLLSPRAFAISIPDEQKLGKEFMAMVRDKGLILHDPVIRHMIDTVGGHIVETLPAQPFHFDFNMINDGSFNAFASPAANIFVHRGLVSALDTMDEFAGIMAHEVAHAASRHVSQSIDRSKLVTVGSLAGMLAGVLIGSAGGGGEAAQALTIGSMAAGQSSMLAFTRDNETEADQKAVLFLDRTGYSPKGLLDGLTKMRAADFRGIEGIPDYFKTHPGTGSRIAHISGILSDYRPPAGKPAAPENYDFQMVKYRVIGLYGSPDKYLDKIHLMLEKNPDNAALHYGLGLLYARINRMELGLDHLNRALAQDPFDPLILIELGRLQIRNQDYASAISVLGGVTGDKILGDLAVYYRAVAQIETGRLDDAEKGLKQVLSSRDPGFARANYHMANIMSKRGKDPLSHYYLGVYYAETMDVKNANRHLSRAIETLADEGLKQDAKDLLDKVLEKAKQSARRR